jgi:hypothetical protein
MLNKKTQKGLSLLETLITVLILSIVMIGFTYMILRVWVANSFTIETGIASRIADRGVREVVKEIRKATHGEDGAYTLEIADEYEIAFYSDLDNDGVTERLRYFIDTDDVFKRGVTEPSGSPVTYDPANDEVVTQVANFVVNGDAGESVFTYYDNLNNAVAYGGNLSSITLVEILLFVNVDQIKAPNNVRIKSKSVIRNLSDFGQAPS